MATADSICLLIYRLKDNETFIVDIGWLNILYKVSHKSSIIGLMYMYLFIYFLQTMVYQSKEEHIQIVMLIGICVLRWSVYLLSKLCK